MEEQKKKNPIQKIKETIEDKEEQLASFGLEGAKKRGDGTYKPDEKPLNKKEVEELLASQSGGYQTVRIETPIKIIGAEIVDPDSPKK